jgi:signal transduction histidine kinase
MPVARFLSRSHLTIASAYLTGYVLLDWVSYVHPFAPFGITPWNPQTGLSFALILLFGLEFVPWLFVAPFLAELLVRQLPLPVGTELLVALISGLGYGGMTACLHLPRIHFDPTLSSKRSLMWLLVAALVGAATVAVAHLGVLVVRHPAWSILRRRCCAFAGDPSADGADAVSAFISRAGVFRTCREMALAALMLWRCDAVRLHRCLPFSVYVFFIPIVSRDMIGLEGVTAGQVTDWADRGHMQISGQTAVDVVSYQALMVVLAATGLAIGVLVSEQQRAQQQLRLQQEALNRASRIRTMGEFAAAVAHEINQPLTSIANYTRLAKRAAEAQPPDVAAAVDAASSAIEQVDRAAQVVRQLREFIQLGRSEASPVEVARLVAETLSFCRPELDRHGIGFESRLARDLPPVMADALQIEQVLANLVRNSAEALAQAGRQDGRVIIQADHDPSGRVAIRVRDNGPGLDPDLIGRPIAPFTTTKIGGLGLGLSLARSIVEAHGGKLLIDSGPRGVEVLFTLPRAGVGEKRS